MNRRRTIILVGGLATAALSATALIPWYNPSLARSVAANLKQIVPIEAPFGAVDTARMSEVGHRRGPEANNTVFITLLTPEECDAVGTAMFSFQKTVDEALADFTPTKNCYEVDVRSGQITTLEMVEWNTGGAYLYRPGALTLSSHPDYKWPDWRSTTQRLLHKGTPVVLAGNLLDGAIVTSDFRTAAVSSILGHRTYRAGMPGMGGAATSYGEVYVQALDVGTGQVFGPAFHLANAPEEDGSVEPVRMYWLVDRKLLLRATKDYQRVWIIAHDWEADAKALAKTPPTAAHPARPAPHPQTPSTRSSAPP